MPMIPHINLLFTMMMIVAGYSDDFERSGIRQAVNRRFEASTLEDQSSMLDLYVQAIMDAEEEYKYEFGKFLGSGAYGIVHEATKTDKSLKIAVKFAHLEDGQVCDPNVILVEHKDKQDSQLINMIEKFELTSTIYYVFEKSEKYTKEYILIPDIKANNAEWLNKIFSTYEIKSKSKKFCFLALEGAEKDLTKPLFTENDTDKAQNSKVLGYVFYRLIEGFYKFNFEENYLQLPIMTTQSGKNSLTTTTATAMSTRKTRSLSELPSQKYLRPTNVVLIKTTSFCLSCKKKWSGSCSFQTQILELVLNPLLIRSKTSLKRKISHSAQKIRILKPISSSILHI